MKKILFAFVVGIIPSLAVLNQSNAQGPGVVVTTVSLDHFFNTFNSGAFEKGTLLNTIDVSKKVLKRFKRVYKVSDARWSVVSNETVASFITDGKSTYVFYDKKGHWDASLKSYHEDKMNHSLKNRVKKGYPDYKIMYVHEIDISDDIFLPTYVVLIEKDKNCKWIRINSGVMDVYREYDMS